MVVIRTSILQRLIAASLIAATVGSIAEYYGGSAGIFGVRHEFLACLVFGIVLSTLAYAQAATRNVFKAVGWIIIPFGYICLKWATTLSGNE